MKFITNVESQLILRKLADFGVLSDGRELIPLYETIFTLKRIVDPNDEMLKEYYGEDYITIKTVLLTAGKVIFTVDAFYSMIDTRKIRTLDIENKEFLRFRLAMAKLPLLIPILMDVFVLLINQTNLKDQSIKSAYWSQAMDKYYKEVRLEKKQADQYQSFGADT